MLAEPASHSGLGTLRGLLGLEVVANDDPRSTNPLPPIPAPARASMSEPEGRFSPRPVPPRPPVASLRERLATSRRETAANAARRRNVPWWRRRPPIWLLVVATTLVFGALLLPRLGDTPDDTFPWTTFMERASGGQVRSAVFTNETGVVTGLLVDGTPFRTTGPSALSPDERRSLGAATELRFRPTPSNEVQQWAPIIASLVIVLIAVALLVRRRPSDAAKSAMTRSPARLGNGTAKGADAITFADVAGSEGVKAELREIVDVLRHPDRYHAIGARLPKGVLLIGAPGTGKTLLARAVAGEANVPFHSISGSDFMEMYVGVGAARVRDLFADARRCAPCIVFIDEIDSVGRKRGAGVGGGHDEREQTLNQLLAELDGFTASSGIVVLGATNRPDVLDAALLRPGRFDRHVDVPLPDREERLEILRVHTNRLSLRADVDLDDVARTTPGMSGADLANLLNEAALSAVRRASTEISPRDLDVARDRVILGVERPSFVLSEDERRITATHESGHAVLAVLLKSTGPLHKVTIVARGAALGLTMSLPADRQLMRRSEVLDQICLAFGGRCAEQLTFGQVTTGAADDLSRATALARRMIREWGMSERIGPMAWRPEEPVFLGEQISRSRDESEATARVVDEEIRVILEEQEQRATTMLTQHRRALDAVARQLAEQETMSGERVRRMVAGGAQSIPADKPQGSPAPVPSGVDQPSS